MMLIFHTRLAQGGPGCRFETFLAPGPKVGPGTFQNAAWSISSPRLFEPSAQIGRGQVESMHFPHESMQTIDRAPRRRRNM